MSTWSVCGMCLDADRWAKFMGYHDEHSWARVHSQHHVVLDGVELRGGVIKKRLDKVVILCNETSGELVF